MGQLGVILPSSPLLLYEQTMAFLFFLLITVKNTNPLHPPLPDKTTRNQKERKVLVQK